MIREHIIFYWFMLLYGLLCSSEGLCASHQTIYTPRSDQIIQDAGDSKRIDVHKIKKMIDFYLMMDSLSSVNILSPLTIELIIYRLTTTSEVLSS